MNKSFYESITNYLPYAFLVLSEGLKVIHCNRSSEILLSKTRNEILGRDLSEFIPHKELRDQVKSVLQSNVTKLVELHLDTKDTKILRAIITPLGATTQDGSDSCLITLEDINERVRLEEQLIQSEKLAGMGLLAATIAHELGNPLSIMSSTLQYIHDAVTNQTIQASSIIEAIDTIMDSIEQMHGLLRSLSGFTGSQRPHFEPTNLCRVLSQMLVFIHKEAETREINVYHQFDDNLPDCYVVPREIKQVFLNLLKNAIEAMPNGGDLHIRLHYAENKDAICVDITDTGHGISEAELYLIFRPFYSTKTDGTGLGLSFCRRVADEHGGEIRIKSELGKGSTFSVILPIKQDVNL
jgi:PAS domain S-box-containing protein